MYRLLGAILIAAGLAYGWHVEAYLAPSDKFNKAFPLSSETKVYLENMQSLIPDNDTSLKDFKNSFESKMILRALTCSQGSSISRFDTIKKIKQLPIDQDCLKNFDEQISQLIGFKLIGFRLSQPPLKPLTKIGKPRLIPNIDSMEIFNASTASNAGVAVLRGTRSEFVSVEIPSGKKISSLPTITDASFQNSLISPNGRVLAISGNNSIHFLDNETGQELYNSREFGQFYVWLPEVQAALVRNNRSGKGEVLIIDFLSGNIKPYSVVPNNRSWALSVSSNPSYVLVGSYRDFSLIENSRTKSGLESSIIRDYKLSGPRANISSTNPTLMLDGKAIVFVSGRDFELFNLETGNEKYWESSEIIGNNYAKLDEETLLVDSYSLGSMTNKPYAFNIKDSSLSPIITSEGSEGIISGFDKRNGFMRRSSQKVYFGDELEIGNPESIDTLIANRKAEKQLQALENAERMAKARDLLSRQNSMPYASPAAEAPAMPAPVPMSMGYPSNNNNTSVQNDVRKLAIISETYRAIGPIPSNARIEAVGVYEAKNRSPSGINIIIKKSNVPIVLILSAYEHVRWNLFKESGANLVGVIATGYNPQEINGAESTKVLLKRGINYAYQANTAAYNALNNDVIMWTGKPINRFQGTYGGTDFMIGN